MSRCNAFLEAGSDSGRRVSVGGRRAQSEVWAHLNTDNASESDCCLKVSASVWGQGQDYKERRRKNGDQRKSQFIVQCPVQDDEFCSVSVLCGNDQSNVLINNVSVKYALACVQIVELLKQADLDGDDAGFLARLRLLVDEEKARELIIS